MEEKRKYVLGIDEITNGYLLHVTNSEGENIKTSSFQWDVSNDQRAALVQNIINRLGLKYDYELKARR